MAEDKAPDVPEGKVIIHIDKDKRRGPVRGSVNGRSYEVATGKDETVPKWLAQSLRDTDIDFRIVAGTLDDGEGGAEGSAPSSTVSKTAIRAEVPGENLTAGVTTPTLARDLPVNPPEIGQVGGAQSGSAGQGNAGGGSKDADAAAEEAIEGNVKDVVASIDESTDLDALKKAEDDREKPRKGVLKAIEAERTRRAEAAQGDNEAGEGDKEPEKTES